MKVWRPLQGEARRQQGKESVDSFEKKIGLKQSPSFIVSCILRLDYGRSPFLYLRPHIFILEPPPRPLKFLCERIHCRTKVFHCILRFLFPALRLFLRYLFTYLRFVRVRPLAERMETQTLRGSRFTTSLYVLAM
jgi:hypothetical protein